MCSLCTLKMLNTLSFITVLSLRLRDAWKKKPGGKIMEMNLFDAYPDIMTVSQVSEALYIGRNSLVSGNVPCVENGCPIKPGQASASAL